jgi:transposase
MQKYLGTAERIGKAVDYMNNGIPKPELTTVFEFGAVTALFDVSERIGLRDIIDKYSGKRAQGLSVGESMILAAINRVVEPTSKNTFYDWYKRTVLYKMFPRANNLNLSSQGFWNNMSLLDSSKIRCIEDAIVHTVVKQYRLRTDTMLFDNTNFFTYIDTANPAKIPQRGKSKQKRSDLKIVGLSMMVSPDHNIPLFHEVYEGNKNDAKRFSEVINTLKKRSLTLNIGKCDITLVFDKGNNNEDNIDDLLKEEPCVVHFVGGLRLSQCPKLLSTPKSSFIALDGEHFKATSAIRDKMAFYGKEMTVVVTNNPELYKTQVRGIENNIAKCESELSSLSIKLRLRHEGITRKGKKPTVESVKKKVKEILSAEHMSDIFDITVSGEEGSTPKIEYGLNIEKYKKLQERKLGKSILFTDRHEWTNEQIVSTYRSQYHVEDAFKQLKNTKYLSFKPIYHWTDDKIRVHAFYCILALMLGSLLNKEVEQLGYKMSTNRMLDEFKLAQQVITVFSVYDSNSKKAAITSFSRFEGMVKEYADKYNLEKYISIV